MILATHGIIKGSSASFLFLLDDYPNAAAAYSVRKLRSAYTGSAIRVRRSSDNTEQNIGFVNNVLDTSSLTSFCGSGNGFVTTWYDQSGNGLNLTQSTAGNQPQIVSSGSVINVNSKPSINWVASLSNKMQNSTLSLSQPSTHILVMKNDNSVDSHIVDRFNGSGDRQVDFLPSGVISIFAGTTLSSGVSVGTNQNLLFNIFNSTSSSIRRNGTSIASGNAGTQNLSGIDVGANNNAQYYGGKLQELVFYNSNQSSNNTGIESNINTYYGIY